MQNQPAAGSLVATNQIYNASPKDGTVLATGELAGTTMPDVLESLSGEERTVAVESLVHFLASTGSVKHASPLRHAANRGEMLYHSVGCVACHDPRGEQAAAYQQRAE